MSEKTIVFITREIVPFHFGGIGTGFVVLSRLLRERGWRTLFLTRRDPNFDQTVFQHHYGDSPICRVDFDDNLPWAHHRLDYAAAVAAAFDTLYKEYQPRVVVSADFGAEPFLTMVQRTLGGYPHTRFVVCISGPLRETLFHNADPDLCNPAPSPARSRALLACHMEDLNLLLADAAIAPSAVEQHEVLQRLPSLRNVAVIPNLHDASLFTGESGPSVPSDGSAIIVYVGRLERRKGVDILVEAFLRLLDGQPRNDLHLHLIGGDCYWHDYGKTFRKYWAEKIPPAQTVRIHFLGTQPPSVVREQLTKATLCVFPSRWEPFGIVCLEAMSMGRPVIASAGTGMEEILGPGFDECLFQPARGATGLEQRIRRLLENRVALPEIGLRLQGRAKALNHKSGEKWSAFFESVAAMPVPPLCLPPVDDAAVEFLQWLQRCSAQHATEMRGMLDRLWAEVQGQQQLIQHEAAEREKATAERERLLSSRWVRLGLAIGLLKARDPEPEPPR